MLGLIYIHIGTFTMTAHCHIRYAPIPHLTSSINHGVIYRGALRFMYRCSIAVIKIFILAYVKSNLSALSITSSSAVILNTFPASVIDKSVTVANCPLVTLSERSLLKNIIRSPLLTLISLLFSNRSVTSCDFLSVDSLLA